MIVRVKTLSGSMEIIADCEPYSEEWEKEVTKNFEPHGTHVHITKGQSMQLSRFFRVAAERNVGSQLAPVFLSIIPSKGDPDAESSRPETQDDA